jgi:hypothetical protein
VGVKDFVLEQIYSTAALVEEAAVSPGSMIELDWDTAPVLNCLARYQRITLLHYYIYAMIAVHMRRDYSKNSDLYETEDIMRLESSLTAYNVDFVRYSEFDGSIPLEVSDLDDPFYRWFRTNEPAFEEMWERATEEVFFLLFANRRFLVIFNQSISTYLALGNVGIPSEFLTSRGRLRRQSNIPAWVKKAVYCRDHGRCVLCGRDLTNLLSTDRHTHYDHIVPLNLWGINDPCNLQLLCGHCNLEKSGSTVQSRYAYPPWWDEDEA